MAATTDPHNKRCRDSCFYPSNKGQLQPEHEMKTYGFKLFLPFKQRAVTTLETLIKYYQSLFLPFKQRAVTTDVLIPSGIIALFLPFKQRAVTTERYFNSVRG